MTRTPTRDVRRPLVEALETRALMSTVTVTSLADSGAGTLREAIASAASGDTIAFGGLQGTITLASTLDLSDKSLTITGSGRNHLTVDASGIDQAFSSVGGPQALTYAISDLKIIGGHAGTAHGAAIGISGQTNADEAAHLSLSNVDITGGVGSELGGGIYSLNTYLTIDHCTIYNNTVTGSAADGGGLYFDTCTLTITASSFYGNTATSSDSTAYALGGGLFVKGTNYCFLTNVTVSNNTAEKTAFAGFAPTPAAGGGMWLSGSAQILASTFAYNTVSAPSASTATNVGGGLYVDPNSTTYVQNTIIADNTAPASADMYSTNTGSILAGFDLIGDGTHSGASNGQYGSQVGTTANPLNAKIGPLAANGGDVRTIALLAGSPAIDAAYNNGPAADARGVSRGSTPDIGAYEYVAPPPAPTFASRPRAFHNDTADGVRLAADVTAAGELTYEWNVVARPARSGKPTFADASSAGTTAAFTKAGTYKFRITASDTDGNVIRKTVTVTVDQVATELKIVQHKKTLSSESPTGMRAFVADQFGNKLLDQPTITWALSEGAGSIDADSGVYTPDDSVHFSHLVFTATAGGLTGTAGNRLFQA